MRDYEFSKIEKTFWQSIKDNCSAAWDFIQSWL